MTDLQPWQFCVGAVLLCFVAFGLWAARNQPSGSAPSPYVRDASKLDNIPNHSEMQAAHVAAAVNQNLAGHGAPYRGEVDIYANDDHTIQSNAAWLEQHGRDGDNQVTVVRHPGTR